MEGTDLQFAECVIDNGSFGTRTIRFETGHLARQAAGSATVYLDGQTMLLSATTASKNPKDQFDFFPLTVDVEERMYSIGRIPGSFFRREGRPSEEAILTCRLIDRPLRPSFVKGLRNEVQVVVTVLSLNQNDLYDVVAINAASMSTQLAGLPFSGPIGGVRVALIRGQWVAFPTHEQLQEAVFDMVVAGRIAGDDVAIMMVEAEATSETIDLVRNGATAPSEEVVAQGLESAKPFIRALCEAQQKLADVAAKPTGEFPVFLDYQQDAYDAVAVIASESVAKALAIPGKQEREAALDAVKDQVAEALAEQFAGREKEVSAALSSVTKKSVRQRVLRDKVRIDGRGLTDIRTLNTAVDIIPRAHGSALFERGETQILGVTTLNMLKLEQQLDTKLDGIPAHVLAAALTQAKNARLAILDVMLEAIDAPDEMSPFAPRIISIQIPVDKIGEVIGPKGKIINQIQEDTGADISIEDDGTAFIAATDGVAAVAARTAINQIANPQMPEIGERYLGTVVKTAAFGAFISLMPGKDGLLHITQLRKLAGGKRVENVDDVVKIGQKILVEIAEIDQRGKLSLVLAEDGDAAAAENGAEG